MNSALTGEIVQASEHLPNGSALVVPGVTWEIYEKLLEEFAERHRFRVSYDCGTLEIVSPLPKHEKAARFVDALVRAWADARDVEVENLGQTTWKLKAIEKGLEADSCYYVRNAAAIIGKDDLDLLHDPPPDIAIEIDNTTNSRRNLSIYAALRVPEIWMYKNKRIQFYDLVDGKYRAISESTFLPGLTGELLAEFIEISATQGQTKALKLFREKIS